jgi:hypothetical protein
MVLKTGFANTRTRYSQRPRKGHLRAQPGAQPDPAEGGAATELAGYEVEED